MLLAAALLVAAAPTHAQRGGDVGLGIRSTTTRPVRTAYRVALDVLRARGYEMSLALMSLDEELTTPPEMANGKPATVQVRITFGRERDSTAYVVMAVVRDPPGDAICYTPKCMEQALEVETLVTSRIKDWLTSYPAGRSLSDSLAAARAYGYTPETAIRVRGTRGITLVSLLDYFDSLRGPGGERVGWLRLGSCCEFSTPNGIEGRGLVEAVEAVYRGMGRPVTLYFNLYDPPDGSEVPYGFTRVAAGPPGT
jgi:hypothetical protein